MAGASKLLTILLLCGSASAFEVYTTDTGETFRWQKSVVTYSFGKTIRKKQRAAIVSALAEWSNVIRIEFSETATDADICFAYSDNKNNRLPSLVLADTRGHREGTTITHCDIRFNKFNPLTRKRLRVVALHEIGHALGIAHSSVETAVMFKTLSSTEVLTPDDVLAGEFLYKYW